MRYLDVTEAVEIVKNKGVIILPTSTLFGISGDGTELEVKQRVMDIKKRNDPRFVYLVDSIEMAKQYVNFDECSQRLAGKFWPGMLTLILESKIDLLGSGTVALRMDPHKAPIEIMKAIKRPLLSTSANISGERPAISLKDIPRQILNRVDGVFMIGDQPEGVASTIVSCEDTGPQILREGAISKQEILKSL